MVRPGRSRIARFPDPLRRPARWLLLPMCAAALFGCVQTQWQTGQSPSGQTLRSADETMDVELTDRVGRVQRLARLDGVAPPRIEQLVVPARDGASRPIPVIRITFAESDFFAPGSATPQAGALAALRVMAENMRHDVPDLRVTVLGHTDATGMERANQALGYARASVMMQALVEAGAGPGQLSVVAIGDAQPIASNATQAGRARNRRVEFLLSPSESANMALVASRPVDPAFLAVAGGAPPSPRRHVAVLRPTYARTAAGRPGYSGPADFSEAPNAPRGGRLTLAEAGPGLDLGGDATGSPVVGGGSPVTGGGSAGPAMVETGSPADPATARYSPP